MRITVGQLRKIIREAINEVDGDYKAGDEMYLNLAKMITGIDTGSLNVKGVVKQTNDGLKIFISPEGVEAYKSSLKGAQELAQSVPSEYGSTDIYQKPIRDFEKVVNGFAEIERRGGLSIEEVQKHNMIVK